MGKMRIRPERIAADLQRLASIGADDTGGITRIAFSPEDFAAREYIRGRFREAGLTVKSDRLGNVFGRRQGDSGRAAAVLIGSHLDSVVEGSNYDGPPGVVAGLEVVRTLNDLNLTTRWPLEVGVFVCEESGTFRRGTVGSRAVAGTLDCNYVRGLVSKQGVSFRSVLQGQGVSVAELPDFARSPQSLRAYLELHIEQGDTLAEAGAPIGIVSAIAASTRLRVDLVGQAGHSGGTMMGKRKDALCGAAEVVLAVERIASQQQGTGVGTVTILDVHGGGMNTVPGHVEFFVDVRDVSSRSKNHVVQSIKDAISEVAQRRDLTAEVKTWLHAEPKSCADWIVGHLEDSADACAIPFRKLNSPTSHDAVHMASLCDIGMVFVRSFGGGHNPKERADLNDIALGTELIFEAVLRIAESDTADDGPGLGSS